MKTKIILTGVLALLLSGCGFNGSPGKSDKIGVIVKLGKVGLMTETWEAQIVRGGFQNGTGAMGAPFDFTIEDRALVELAKKYMDEGREVKITYERELCYSAFRSEAGGDFLVKIEPVAKTNP